MGGVFDEAWLTSHQQKMARQRHPTPAREPALVDATPSPVVSTRRGKPRLVNETKIKLLAASRPVRDEVIIDFSLPPSSNRAWRNTENAKARVRSDAYMAWVISCCTVLCDVRIGRVEGPYSVLIEARRPMGAKGALRDVDNLIKPTLDVLKNCGMTADDRYCQEVTARWAMGRGKDGIVVVIRKWGGA